MIDREAEAALWNARQGDDLLTWGLHCSLSPLASLGTCGEDRRKPITPGGNCPNRGVHIGDRTTIREFVTVNGGFEAPTRIGDDCYIMAHAHVGHDCVIHDGVTLATRATLGGHTIVHEGANVGLGAITHQRVTIGAYAMIGAGAVVIRDVPPFATVVGNPARVIGVNRVGMERAGFSEAAIRGVEGPWEYERIILTRGTASTEHHYEAWRRDAGRHK